MADYFVPVPDPRCDECSKPVEESQVAKSVRNGVALGPWLCRSCEHANSVHFAQQIVLHQHQNMVQNNYFDSICNDADPKLAEAIHRAKLA